MVPGTKKGQTPVARVVMYSTVEIIHPLAKYCPLRFFQTFIYLTKFIAKHLIASTTKYIIHKNFFQGENS